MRSMCALFAVSVVAVASSLVAVAAPVMAQTDDEPPTIRTTTSILAETPAGVGSIVGPKPGEGVPPDDAGDRGGAAQLLLFGAIVAALAGIVFFIRRDMQRSRGSQPPAETGGDPGQPDESATSGNPATR